MLSGGVKHSVLHRFLHLVSRKSEHKIYSPHCRQRRNIGVENSQKSASGDCSSDWLCWGGALDTVMVGVEISIDSFDLGRVDFDFRREALL